MKMLKLLFHSLVVFANVIVILLFIAAAYSDRIEPSAGIVFSYLGLGFGVIAFLNLCFFIYWIILRRWVMVMVVAASFGLCWGAVSTYFPLHCSKQQPPEGALKILTYNVMGFAYKNHTEKSPNEIVEYIANSGADIVCLQEYMVYPSEKQLTSQKLFKALKMYPYHKVMDKSLAVFSKYPITQSRQINYKSAANGSAIHQIEVKGKKLILINNHLESLKLTSEDKTKYKVFIKSLGSDQFDGLKGTFQQKLGPAFRLREKQADTIAMEVKDAGDHYILVCGDFNDTPVSYAHAKVAERLVDSFAESGCGLGVSYNQNLFFFRIDHILHSPNMKAYNCTVDRKIKASDHYPVWCYVTLEEE